MDPKSSPVSEVANLNFVADISYNPRTHQYRIQLAEPFSSELPRTRNFLLVDVVGFTIEKVLESFEQNVITYYQTKCDHAREVLKQVRQQRGGDLGDDIMNEW